MSRTRIVAVVALTSVAAGVAGAQEARHYIAPRTAAETGQPPFSGAVQIGNTLYLSGDIGLDENQRVPDTAEAEAQLLLDSIQRTLSEAGFTMDDLVSVQVFCSDVTHYAAFNSVYRTYFQKEFPARAFIGSGALLFNARFEMQAIAVKR